MVDFADAGGVIGVGIYLFTAPVVLADGPQPGPVDAMWLYGLSKAYGRGRRVGQYVDDYLASKDNNENISIEELEWKPKQQLLKNDVLAPPALLSGSWHVTPYDKKKKEENRISNYLYA